MMILVLNHNQPKIRVFGAMALFLLLTVLVVSSPVHLATLSNFSSTAESKPFVEPFLPNSPPTTPLHIDFIRAQSNIFVLMPNQTDEASKQLTLSPDLLNSAKVLVIPSELLSASLLNEKNNDVIAATTTSTSTIINNENDNIISHNLELPIRSTPLASSNETELVQNPFASSPYQSSNEVINSLIANIFSNFTLNSLPPEELIFGALPQSDNETRTIVETSIREGPLIVNDTNQWPQLNHTLPPIMEDIENVVRTPVRENDSDNFLISLGENVDQTPPDELITTEPIDSTEAVTVDPNQDFDSINDTEFEINRIEPLPQWHTSPPSQVFTTTTTATTTTPPPPVTTTTTPSPPPTTTTTSITTEDPAVFNVSTLFNDQTSSDLDSHIESTQAQPPPKQTLPSNSQQPKFIDASPELNKPFKANVNNNKKFFNTLFSFDLNNKKIVGKVDNNRPIRKLLTTPIQAFSSDSSEDSSSENQSQDGWQTADLRTHSTPTLLPGFLRQPLLPSLGEKPTEPNHHLPRATFEPSQVDHLVNIISLPNYKFYLGKKA